MSLALTILGLGVWAGLIGIAAYWVFYAFTTDDESFDLLFPKPILRIVTSLLLAAAVIVPLAFAMGEISFTDIPDGCYRIGHETSSGVGISPSGQVIPIVTSGRVYTPIACPA